MMRKSFIPIIILMLVLVSCHKTKYINNNQQNIVYNFDNDIISNDSFINLIDSVQFVKLNTSDNFLIGKINKVIVNDNFFYILDRDIAESLFKFSITGKALLKIGGKGRGPGEYLYPSDFFITSNYISVMNADGGHILLYNKNGVFLKEIITGIYSEIIEKIDDENFVLINDDIDAQKDGGNWLTVYNIQRGMTNKYLNFPPIEGIGSGSFEIDKIFSCNNNSVDFMDFVHGEIYNITKDSISLKYSLDFGKDNVPDNFFNKKLDLIEYLMKIHKQKYVFYSGNFNETEKYLYFTVAKGKWLYLAFYNKKNKSFIVDFRHLPDWLQKIMGIFKYSTSNYFVSVIDPKSLSEMSTKDKDHINKHDCFKGFNKIIDNTSDIDNPVLALWYFK